MSEQDKDDDQPKYKITFAPGCFDEFDGTQEELDQLVAMLTEMAESGELAEKGVPLDELEDIDEEVLDILPLLTAGNTRH